VGIANGRRRVKLNDKAPKSLADYATRSPVVVFDPQQMTLSMGPASERRTLLDRVTLFTHPEIAADRSRYQKALRDRQRLLAEDWPRFERPELDAYETLLAEHGVALTRARAHACKTLEAELRRAWDAIAAPELELSASYDARGSTDVEQAARQLREDRSKDAKRKSTSFGPHRDDIAISIDDHPARVVASQGQHRAITLALKSAELVCIARARDLEPILLLDDVSSELDADRTAALFRFLSTTKSQIFLTTTRRDLIVTPAKPGDERRDFAVRSGVLERMEDAV
jgi:DNA replication and repair protein RecF